MTPLDPSELKYSWSAVVRLNNDIIDVIWYTAWPTTKDMIKEIISIASDYPKHLITNN